MQPFERLDRLEREFSRQLGGGMATVMFHMVQGGLFSMEKRVFAVVHRLFRLMTGPDIVFFAAMCPGSFMMTLRRVMMLGGHCMMLWLSEIDWSRHSRRS